MRVVGAGPSNATALIKIDDSEIARGQFDECRYPFNCRSRIARHDDRHRESIVFLRTLECLLVMRFYLLEHLRL